MTTTMSEIDMDTIMHLDFEESVPCDLTCDNEAEWKVVTACCGHKWLFCDECFERNVLNSSFRSMRMNCSICNQPSYVSDIVANALRIKT